MYVIGAQYNAKIFADKAKILFDRAAIAAYLSPRTKQHSSLTTGLNAMHLTGKIETDVGPSLSGNNVIIDVKVTDENGTVSYKKRLIVSNEDYDFIAASFDSSEIRYKELFIAHSVMMGRFDKFDRTKEYD